MVKNIARTVISQKTLLYFQIYLPWDLMLDIEVENETNKQTLLSYLVFQTK